MKSRGLFVKNILELTGKPCRFAVHGCKEVITELNQHETQDCFYRQVRCIFANCFEQMSMAYLMDHLSKPNAKHPGLKLPLSLVNQNISQGGLFLRDNWDEKDPTVNLELNRNDFLQVENFKFFFARRANNLTRKCYYWVYFLGPPNEAKKFGFQLRLFKEDSEKEIQISGPVASVIIPYPYMRQHPLSFQISFEEIREFWNQAIIQFNWEVTIFKKSSHYEMNEMISVKNI